MAAEETWPAPSSSSAAKASRPQERSGRRRAEILRSALAVFGERGYANGSLSEIAERVGMTHSGVLHHFGSKEQLLIALLEYRDEADVAELEGHHAPWGAAFLDHLIMTAKENTGRPGIVQAYSTLLGESLTDHHPARAYFTERFRGLRSMVCSAVADASGRPEDDEAVTAAASAIIATMDGLQTQWLLDSDAVAMHAAVSLVIHALVEELSSGPRV